MENVIITTTNQIENTPIERYLDVVSTNLVIGTNILSDFAASFTDFFGGYSNSYQNKLRMIYKDAIKSLSDQVLLLGGNALIGLHVDFDEISGKSKSMFMVSAMGTAVKIKKCNEQVNLSSEKTNEISCSQLTYECKKRQYLKKFNSDGMVPTEEDWEYLKSYFIPEIVPLLYKEYQKLIVLPTGSVTNIDKLLLINFPFLLAKLDYENAVNVIYYNIESSSSAAIKLIKDLNLFNSQKVLELIDKDMIDIVIDVLSCDKSIYKEDDIKSMEEIINRLDNLPDKGKIAEVKGLLSKSSTKYICPKGHKNDVDIEFCDEFDCGLNIKGLTKEDTNKIEIFRNKVQTLKDLLYKKQ